MYQFLTDADNQRLSAYSKRTAISVTTGLTASGGAVYMAKGGSAPVYQLNQDGTLVKAITGNLPASHNGVAQNALDLVTNPVNGHLFLSTGFGGEIFEINPTVTPATMTLFATGLTGPDGLGITADGSLTTTQREVAVFADHSVGNIITERGRAQALREPTGLPFAELGEGQRELLMALVGEYVGNAADPLGVPYLARVREAGLERLRLAWAGGMSEGEAFYYRVHGPRLLIELDCTQNDANHIHSLWRDPTADWGRDVLGEHYLHDHDHD